MKTNIVIILALFAMAGVCSGEDISKAKISESLQGVLSSYDFKRGSTTWQDKGNITVSGLKITSGVAYVVFSEKRGMTAQDYEQVALEARDFFRETYSDDSRAGAEDGMLAAGRRTNESLDGQQHCHAYFHDEYVAGGSLKLSCKDNHI